MKKVLLNSDWYFKYKTVGNQAFDQSEQMISLPHDAMIGLDCSVDGDRKKGFYPNVHLLYSKEIYIHSEWKGEYIVLQFDGIYKNSRVYVNGVYACGDGRPTFKKKLIINLQTDVRLKESSVWRFF